MIYNYEKEVSLDLLRRQIESSEIVEPLKGINQSGDMIEVVFENALTLGEETILDAIVMAHDHTAPILDNIVESRVEFGMRLVREFTVRNQLSGKSDEDLFLMTDNLDIQKIVFGLNNGFLEYALFKVQNLELDGDRITQDDKDWTIAKIGGYLGL